MPSPASSLLSVWAGSYSYSSSTNSAMIAASNLNSDFIAAWIRACTADMTFKERSRRARVVPTGVSLLMSWILSSATAAKERPCSTMMFIRPRRVWLGSLYGRNAMFSAILPLAMSTSLNSPGAIGVSSPLIRRPRVFRPPGRFESVPASTS